MKQSINIALISVGLGFLFDYLFFDQGLGLSFPIYVLLILGGLVLIHRSTGKSLDKSTALLALPILFFSLMISIRANEFLTFLNVIATLALLLFLVRNAAGALLDRYRVIDYINTLFLPFRLITPARQTIGGLWSGWTNRTNHQLTAQIIRGLLIAVPLIIVFLALFSSADLVFNKYITDIITIDLSSETVVRTALITIISLGFIGAYTYTTAQSERANQVRPTAHSNLGPVENMIILGSVNLVFLGFVALQAAYLFGGETTIAAQGFTYADYARRGFFELIAVAAISLGLIYLLDKQTAKKTTGHHTVFRVLSSVLIAQVGVIIASAWTRLALYEQAYGLTTLRFYSYAGIVLLIALFILALVKIHVDHREETFALRAAIALIVLLGTINLVNPDAYIARQNIERFGTTDKLDAGYLSTLSTDATAELILLDRIENSDLKSAISQSLIWQKTRLTNDAATTDWRSWNYSRHKAQQLLNNNQAALQ